MAARTANSSMAAQNPLLSSFCSAVYMVLYQVENRTSRRTAHKVRNRIRASAARGRHWRRGEKYGAVKAQNCRPHTVNLANTHIVAAASTTEIGRASWRERVCQDV